MSEEPKPKNGDYFTIGELAREFDITTRTIRFYEDQGLLAPLREGRKRLFRRRDRARLKLILRGKRLGFTLDEIKETFDLYDDSARGEEAQLRYYLGVLAEKRNKLLRQRQDIDETLGELERSERQCLDILGQKRRQRQTA